ncbi:hypothetical protein ACWD0E_34370, partial [Streptomyces sp. NPDC003002]
RLDPVLIADLIHEGGHLGSFGSSSRAKKIDARPQDRVRPFQVLDRPLQLRDPQGIRRRGPGPLPGIGLRPLYPPASTT